MSEIEKKLSSKYFVTNQEKRQRLSLAYKLWSNLKEETYIRSVEVSSEVVDGKNVETRQSKVWKNGADTDPDSHPSAAKVKNKTDALIPYIESINAADLIIKVKPIERASSFGLDLQHQTGGRAGIRS